MWAWVTPVPKIITITLPCWLGEVCASPFVLLETPASRLTQQ